MGPTSKVWSKEARKQIKDHDKSCLKRAVPGEETLPKKGKMRKNKNEKTTEKLAMSFRTVPKKKKKKNEMGKRKTMKWDYSVRINFDKSQY